MTRGLPDKPVLLISDIHTKFGVINAQILHAEESCGQSVGEVLVLGDFGFFADELHEHFRKKNRRFLRPVSFIEGNHEDHGELGNLASRFADVVTYLPRSTLYRLGSWRGLCLGGARYMDSWSTPRGCEITSSDIDACLAHPPDEVDLVLSHDCPSDIGVPNTPGFEYYGKPGVPLMSRLAEHFRPRWWFFGHHHRWFDLSRDGTRYIGLPQCWVGYALLYPDGEIELIQHSVTVESRSWLKRLFGIK
ncbi:MAG: metallophosphoesterase [Gemmatimonadales bacterium]|nr:metallophosphoesterase [Gemmatimonadales bacterium]